MTPPTNKQIRVLAIAPCVQGIGFVLFNGPRLPVDWGIKWTREAKNRKGVACTVALLGRYRPDVLVLEDHRGAGSRRARRIEALLDAIAAAAGNRHIKVLRYSRARVRNVFAPGMTPTKHQIAKAIAEAIPELAVRYPGARKIWLPEHPNMSIFDAAALAVTHYALTAPADGRAAFGAGGLAEAA
jgi:hypothetical protein